MKKILFISALLACAVVSSQGATLWKTTFGNAAQAAASQVTFINEGEVTGITGSVTSLQKNPYNGDPYSDLILNATGTIGGNASLFTPWYNVQATGAWDAGMSFTNGSASTVSISSISFTLVSFGVNSNTGAAIPHTQSRDFVFTLTIGDQSHDVTVTIPSGRENSATFTLDSPLLVDAGSDFSFHAKASRTADQQNGGFVGIKDISFDGLIVPEPAVASLNLLGLALLMVRRRRA